MPLKQLLHFASGLQNACSVYRIIAMNVPLLKQKPLFSFFRQKVWNHI